ncbi:MAG TPA: metallophosphoesterase [Ktedonobacterales bacterium]|nr:metallophosphoesterase [Ktedonobacterales bacterium]
MATAIISDLHLGAAHGDDLLRYPFFCDLLREQLDGIDHIVLLGDILDLRFQQLEDALLLATPFLTMLGDALGQARHPRVTYIPGNHDYHYAVRLIETEQERAIEAGEPFSLRQIVAPPDFFLSRQLARIIGNGVDVRFVYFYDMLESSEGPIFLTHGHYLDLHLGAAPARLLSLLQASIAAAGQTVTELSPDLYEAILRPQYELLHWIGQSPGGGQIQSRIYERLRGGAPPRRTPLRQIRRAALRGAASVGGRVGVALAETLANRIVKGGLSLTSPARDAQAEVTIDAFNLSLEELEPYLPQGMRYVIFGHTHRPGPLEEIDTLERWKVNMRNQETVVMNCGSWLYDDGKARRLDYRPQRWPGTFILVPDQGPPRLVEVLAHLSKEEVEAQMSERDSEEPEDDADASPVEQSARTDLLLDDY